ncbi:hypothetical protein DV736_g6561, partial [Chaetothyriales sp. CBS 134916]
MAHNSSKSSKKSRQDNDVAYAGAWTRTEGSTKKNNNNITTYSKKTSGSTSTPPPKKMETTQLLRKKMARKWFYILFVVRDVVSLLTAYLSLQLRGRLHRLTYKTVEHPKNVVVIGGSFAGWFLVDTLSKSLPTGWRVILIEKNSHFHYTWLWPRMVGVPGHDHKSAVPYPASHPQAPNGIVLLKKSKVINIETRVVVLDGGERVPFEYLGVTTGSSPRFPSGLIPLSKGAVLKYFQSLQEQVRVADSIILVGGGPVGVEIGTDIKSRYPEKSVTIVHSRGRLMNNFGPRLHEAGIKACKDLRIQVYLEERPAFPKCTTDQHGSLTLKSGETVEYDLLINCTGQRIDSSLMKEFSPDSIGPDGGILVNSYLQILKAPPTNTNAIPEVHTNIFAAGDVATLPASLTGGFSIPKMGRVASFQGMLVAKNIVRAIQGKTPEAYRLSSLDRGLKLTLGLNKAILYMTDGDSEVTTSQENKAKNDDQGLPAVHHQRDPTLRTVARRDDTLPLRVTNFCKEVIYTGILTQSGTGPGTGGFKLDPDENNDLAVSADWVGRVWGRTNCTFFDNSGSMNSSNPGGTACATGDCGNLVECQGAGGPSTLAEFTYASSQNQSFYDISLVDGYNLPIAIRSLVSESDNAKLADIPPNLVNPVCIGSASLLAPPGSASDQDFGTNSSYPLPLEQIISLSEVADWCPFPLLILPFEKPGDGVYPYPDDSIQRPIFSPCQSACSKWNKPQYCCTGNHDDPGSCKPSYYSTQAKKVCPDAYSFAYDDETSTFIIPQGAGFEVIFCPSGRSTNILATFRPQLLELAQTGHVTRAIRDLATNKTWIDEHKSDAKPVLGQDLLSDKSLFALVILVFWMCVW